MTGWLKASIDKLLFLYTMVILIFLEQFGFHGNNLTVLNNWSK